MNVRLGRALDWVLHREPVKVCRGCGVPAVGTGIGAHCPACGIESVNDPWTSATRSWDDLKPWAPSGTLVVADEEPL